MDRKITQKGKDRKWGFTQDRWDVHYGGILEDVMIASMGHYLNPNPSVLGSCPRWIAACRGTQEGTNALEIRKRVEQREQRENRN